MADKTLWTFGDSFTYGFGCRYIDKKGDNIEYDYYHKYYDSSKGHDIWPNHLGRLLNSNVQNFGSNGNSNWDIIDDIIKQSDNIKKGDYVVIGKTRFDRNRFPDSNLKWNFLDDDVFEQPKQKPGGLNQEMVQAAIDYQIHFSTNDLLKERQELYYKYIIDNLIKVNKVKSVITFNINKLKEIERICHHSEFDDYHPSFNGHLDMAHRFYNEITFSII